MKNKFIVFEGLDGSGSSTQASLLVNKLNSLEKATVLTEEPSTGPIGALIRQIFQGRVTFGTNKTEFDKMMAFLFAADRVDHLHNSLNGVMQTLETKNVVSTRYYYSSLAYHANSLDEIEYVYNLNKDFYRPDLIFYLDIKPNKSMDRIKNRHTKDEYENIDKLSIVSKNYNYIFSELEPSSVILDGTLSIEQLQQTIFEKTMEIM